MLLFSLLLISLTSVYARASINSTHYACEELDNQIRISLSCNTPKKSLLHSIRHCGSKYIYPTTLTYSVIQNHIYLLNGMLESGVSITEPALVIRSLIKFGDYQSIIDILLNNPTRTTDFELAVNDAIESLGCPKNPVGSIQTWKSNINTIASLFYGSSDIWNGWYRVLLSAAECNTCSYEQATIVREAVVAGKGLLSISKMEQVLANALKFKGGHMIFYIEQEWPKILWKRLSPVTIRSTMDVEMIQVIRKHSNPYLSSIKALLPSYSVEYVADEPITGLNSVAENYWKGVGYIIGSRHQPFEAFWSKLKQLPMAEENYYAVFVRAACLAKKQDIVRYLLDNPPQEISMTFPRKLGIAKQLLSVPETISWLKFSNLPDVYCSLADSDVTYGTRCALLLQYSKSLTFKKANELRMSHQCYSHLKDMKASELISDIQSKYRLVRFNTTYFISTPYFHLNYLIDAKHYLQIEETLKRPELLYQTIVANEDFDFKAGHS